jgi:glyceraldehyde 3-phosphate dehydrogenase
MSVPDEHGNPGSITVKVGINGFGRMGRLALRAGWSHPALQFVAINEPAASAETSALLLEFDSVHGRWATTCGATASALTVGDRSIGYTMFDEPGDIPWRELGVDLVLECSGRFRTTALLQPHFEQGAARVLVSAPVKDGPPNIVVGVNDMAIDFAAHPIVTAASCTTNCLAPVVRVLHDGIGIERGLVTTIHAPTNTQRVVDAPHADPRRARAAQLNLIPTSTNSATAVGLIIPELAGKLDSIAVRAPVLNASITDCVFQVARDTTVAEVNGLLHRAAEQAPLVGILGFEERPLVSSDFAGDPRSAIVDSRSTRVTDRRLVKVLAWYDNEWGYANRLVDLAQRLGAAMEGGGAQPA